MLPYSMIYFLFFFNAYSLAFAPAGFTGIQEFGDFAGSPFSPESIPLLVKASV